MTSSHNHQPDLDRRFPWTRYWRLLPAGNQGSDHFVEGRPESENGFLYVPADPHADLDLHQEIGLRTLIELLESPAVVLRGRPGSGKTTEMQRARLEGAFGRSGVRLMYREARAFEGSADDLLAEVRPDVSNGKKASLVLDGADELLTEHAKFLNSLEAGLDEFKQQGWLEHLRLVISCRSVEWPEGKLAHLWPQGQFAIAELCRLDWESAEAFVSHHLPGQGHTFWDEVHALKIEFLAIWPHSLAALVEEFRANGGRLPGTLFELVQRTANARCDVHHSETDAERRERLRPHDVPQSWSYRLASRAAAMGCFSGQSMLSIQPGDAGKGFISTDEFLHGVEPMPDGTLRQIEQKDLADMKRLSAIFDSVAGGKRLVFSHQMMREFLAASWLADRHVPVSQLEQLFGCRREDRRWRHFPQLAAIAAWLASHPDQKAWRTFLIQNDPAVLLRADAAGLADGEKEEIAKALLECAVRDRAVDPGWRHHQFRGLACQGLGEILRPYILNDSSGYEAARHLALDIVREARPTEVADALWQAVRMVHGSQRSDIAYALQEVCKDSHEKEWREVLDGGIPLDDQGALLGAALDVMVPSKLNVRDVLRHLIPKRDFGIIGIYALVHDRMVEHMEKADALAVVRHSINHHASGFATSWGRNESLLSKALLWLAEDMDAPENVALFVEWWVSAILATRQTPEWQGTPVTLKQLGFESSARRHAVLECAAQLSKLQNIRPEEPFWSRFDVFVKLPEDVEWLAGKIDTAEPRAARIYAGWLEEAFYRNRDQPEVKAALGVAYAQSAAVRSTLPTPVSGRSIFEELDARSAERRRKSAESDALFEARRKMQDQGQADKIASLRRQARELYEQGHPDAWRCLVAMLFLEVHRDGIAHNLQLVDAIFAKKENWMFESARRWLQQEPEAFPMQGKEGALDYQYLAARALYVLWGGLEDDAELMSAIKKGWLPHVLSIMLRLEWGMGEFNFEKCLQRFYPESVSALMEVIRADYLSDGNLWTVRHLSLFADDALSPMKDLLLEVPPQPQGFCNAFSWLAANGIEAAEAVAKHWLRQVPDGKLDGGDVVLFAAILIHLQGRLWREIRPRLCGDLDVSKVVLERAFREFHTDEKQRLLMAQWSAEYLSEIAELALMAFPSSFEEFEIGVPENHALIRSRDLLVSELADRGAHSAVQRLESLKILGTERWLRQVHFRAQSNDHATRWQPLPAKDFLLFVSGHELRLAATDDDLLRAVMIYLHEYERALAATSHGQALLNDNGKPKHEERLSDHLAQWLEDRHGIRRIRENQTPAGKKEDITVALDRPGKSFLSVCIEVKKHDSAQLLEKIRTQLLEQYLKAQQGRTHGIYVVFWFADGNSPAHPGINTAEDAASYLEEQAELLSEAPYRLAAKVIDCRHLPLPRPKSRKPAKKAMRRSDG